MKKLIAGNWKMNGTEASAMALTDAIGAGLQKKPDLLERCDFLVCPPFVHLTTVRSRMVTRAVALGAQNCAADENGAYTGDVSAAMLRDIDCSFVILGHSERRTFHKETSFFISEKAARAHMHDLVALICVGETEDEREAGQEFDVVARQLRESIPGGADARNTVIAYEPVWAIGTGKSATPDDVAAMHGFIREKLADFGKMRILYGGSVKPENAKALFAIEDVNGALIGGASLKAEDFLGIAEAA